MIAWRQMVHGHEGLAPEALPGLRARENDSILQALKESKGCCLSTPEEGFGLCRSNLMETE